MHIYVIHTYNVHLNKQGLLVIAMVSMAEEVDL